MHFLDCNKIHVDKMSGCTELAPIKLKCRSSMASFSNPNVIIIMRNPFIFQWNPYFHNYRNKIRNSLRQFRALGDKLIQQRLTLVKTDDNPPSDLLAALIKAHSKLKPSHVNKI